MWIKNYIMTIISVVLISGISESLMPNTNMKKHISLVVGLIILFAIVKPIISIPNITIDNMLLRLEDDATVSSEMINKKIEKFQYEIIDNEFSSSVSNTISNAIYSYCGVKCKVKTLSNNGIIDSIIINAPENENIKEFVKNTYGLECKFKKD